MITLGLMGKQWGLYPGCAAQLVPERFFCVYFKFGWGVSMGSVFKNLLVCVTQVYPEHWSQRNQCVIALMHNSGLLW